MAIILHRNNFFKGLSIVDRKSKQRGIVVAVAENGVVAWLDDGRTLYLGADEARLRLASAP